LQERRDWTGIDVVFVRFTVHFPIHLAKVSFRVANIESVAVAAAATAANDKMQTVLYTH
jgi:hypothetical protein